MERYFKQTLEMPPQQRRLLPKGQALRRLQRIQHTIPLQRLQGEDSAMTTPQAKEIKALYKKVTKTTTSSHDHCIFFQKRKAFCKLWKKPCREISIKKCYGTSNNDPVEVVVRRLIDSKAWKTSL
jgi:hypothetical protein